MFFVFDLPCLDLDFYGLCQTRRLKVLGKNNLGQERDPRDFINSSVKGVGP